MIFTLLTRKLYLTLLAMTVTLFATERCLADEDPISLFPLDHYDQTISTWIAPDHPDYDKPLLSTTSQQARLDSFYNHFFGAASPWNPDRVNKILRHTAPDDLKSLETDLIHDFSNAHKSDIHIGYGANFLPHSDSWIREITQNIHLAQFDHTAYVPEQRGIAIENLHARALPTDDVHFYHHRLAGQGYPFDNLQMSSLWVGTPVYILGESLDRAWYFVLTPDYIAWVKSSGIAKADPSFINIWQRAAKQHIGAIIKTQTSVIDEQGDYRFQAYVGSIFPAEASGTRTRLMIPIKNENQRAVIHFALLPNKQAVLIPWPLTARHTAEIMATLIQRPYGWGNMYFYNDCSAEMKSLYTPFGIWLPRHSSDQAYAGNMIDLSSATPEQRLQFLINNGHPYTTLIYIGNHIVMYLGSQPNPNSKDHEAVAMTYQNMWGIRPNPPIRRAIIGQSVIFPFLLQYPEDASLNSQANKSHFQVTYLDDMPNYLMKLETLELKSLMYP